MLDGVALVSCRLIVSARVQLAPKAILVYFGIGDGRVAFERYRDDNR